MKFYQEIRLFPNSDISPYFLWAKVYQQIHLALVEMQDSEGKVPIGVAFPEYEADVTNLLGKKLRLFAEDETLLEQLDVKKWLARLTDYVDILRITIVPINAVQGYVVYKRQQSKSNLARLARRKAKKTGVSFEEIMTEFNKHKVKAKWVNTPFIHVKSQSSQKEFRLFIAKKQAEEEVKGTFTSYGLSSQATVPYF